MEIDAVKVVGIAIIAGTLIVAWVRAVQKANAEKIMDELAKPPEFLPAKTIPEPPKPIVLEPAYIDEPHILYPEPDQDVIDRASEYLKEQQEREESQRKAESEAIEAARIEDLHHTVAGVLLDDFTKKKSVQIIKVMGSDLPYFPLYNMEGNDGDKLLISFKWNEKLLMTVISEFSCFRLSRGQRMDILLNDGEVITFVFPGGAIKVSAGRYASIIPVSLEDLGKIYRIGVDKIKITGTMYVVVSFTPYILSRYLGSKYRTEQEGRDAFKTMVDKFVGALVQFANEGGNVDLSPIMITANSD